MKGRYKKYMTGSFVGDIPKNYERHTVSEYMNFCERRLWKHINKAVSIAKEASLIYGIPTYVIKNKRYVTASKFRRKGCVFLAIKADVYVDGKYSHFEYVQA